MQSDYVSAFGIGGLIDQKRRDGRSIRAIDDDEDESATAAGVCDRSSPSILASVGANAGASGGAASAKKRNRFHSVETTPTTNTSSSSTDTVSPLHGLAAKTAMAVLRRSHSIKQVAQAKRKSMLRSLSHTAAAPSHHDDHHELEHLKIKYESFCNRPDDDDDEEKDEENDESQDADVEDADDADENDSLLHKATTAAAAALASSSSSQPLPFTADASNKDINNNTGLDNSTANNDEQNFKVIIVNNSVSAGATTKAKRVESIRMRHHSNLGASAIHMGANQDAVSSSSSSRLKYFKCRKNKIRSKASQRRHNYLIIFLLFIVNLLNYIDRYTLAGTYTHHHQHYDIHIFFFSTLFLRPLANYY